MLYKAKYEPALKKAIHIYKYIFKRYTHIYYLPTKELNAL
jgi:hypothetical protein